MIEFGGGSARVLAVAKIERSGVAFGGLARGERAGMEDVGLWF